MERPLVSILIPVYQRAELAMEAIDSALAQDYPETEIIISDNCSADGTYELLIKQYGNNDRIKIFQNKTNLGAVENWKRCLTEANGKYIKFLWSDDLITSDYLSSTVRLLERYPNAAFAFTSVIIFDSLKDLEDQKANWNKAIGIYDAFCTTGEYAGKQFINAAYSKSYSVPVSPGCAIFRKEKLHIISNIPNKLNYQHKKNGAGPDLLMFLEALAHGESFVYLNQYSSYFRRHSDSISSFDKSIMDGYFSAKIYYMKKYGLTQLCADLNSEIVSTQLGRKVFNPQKNQSVLRRYYDETDFCITQISIWKVLLWKIRTKHRNHKTTK